MRLHTEGDFWINFEGKDSEGKTRITTEVTREFFEGFKLSELSVDEFIISPWFHLERLSENGWYVRLGNQRFNLLLDNEGKVVSVDSSQDS